MELLYKILLFSKYYYFYEIRKMQRPNVFVDYSTVPMRGRTFNDCFILLDEAQNTTPEQMFMIMTRIGKNCKLIITDDLRQSDLRGKNGLHDLLYKASSRLITTDAIRIVEFKVENIMRSSIRCNSSGLG